MIDNRIPVHVLTGFLGSGKTTILRHVLSEPEFSDTAVIINEFGEIGLDHLLVREVSDDVVLLSSGCLCCSMRDDLVSTLARLMTILRRGTGASFRRVVVETSGLADPAPIIQVLASENRLRRIYRAGAVIATVDAISGENSISSFAEAIQQVALADRAVITKTDLVEPWRVAAVEAAMAKINPTIKRVVSGRHEMPSAADLFRLDPCWHARPAMLADDCSLAGAHSAGVATFAVDVTNAVDWPAFVDWLELLLVNRGSSILRVKGLLPVAGETRPAVIQSVQHVVYPPEYLPRWRVQTPQGWLVFIARNLTRAAIERSLPSTFAAAR